MAPLKTTRDLSILLGKSMTWVNHHVHGWPCTRLGRSIRFTETHVAEILAMYEQRPVAAPTSDEISRKRETRRRGRAA